MPDSPSKEPPVRNPSICLTLRCTVVAGLFGLATAHAASLGTSGYSQNFDAMGTTGTAAPIDWTVYTGASGTSNTTWSTTIPGSGVAAMVPTTAALTATTTPNGTNNNGFNAALSASATSDRVLATSPTQVSGAALQVVLTNDTGAAVDSLSVGYDTVRFTSVSTANELPGYWLFYSLDNTTWTNVSSLNPTIATVPNTVGVTSTAGSFSLGASVAPGASIELRWVDDNAVQTSPDQIIGLNNVVVAAVPEADGFALALAGLAFTGLLAARRRKA